MALVLVLLKLPTPPGTMKEKLAKMDWMFDLMYIKMLTIADDVNLREIL